MGLCNAKTELPTIIQDKKFIDAYSLFSTSECNIKLSKPFDLVLLKDDSNDIYLQLYPMTYNYKVIYVFQNGDELKIGVSYDSVPGMYEICFYDLRTVQEANMICTYPYIDYKNNVFKIIFKKFSFTLENGDMNKRHNGFGTDQEQILKRFFDS